jgi:hypothetical protein
MNYYSYTTLIGSPSLPPKTVLTVSGNANHPIPQKKSPGRGFFLSSPGQTFAVQFFKK